MVAALETASGELSGLRPRTHFICEPHAVGCSAARLRVASLFLLTWLASCWACSHLHLCVVSIAPAIRNGNFAVNSAIACQHLCLAASPAGTLPLGATEHAAGTTALDLLSCWHLRRAHTAVLLCGPEPAAYCLSAANIASQAKHPRTSHAQAWAAWEQTMKGRDRLDSLAEITLWNLRECRQKCFRHCRCCFRLQNTFRCRAAGVLGCRLLAVTRHSSRLPGLKVSGAFLT
jgi:hypothetical protein